MYIPVGQDAAEIAAGFTDGDQFEYIELLNISASPLDLNDVTFTSGVEFNFAGANVTELAPGGRALIVRNRDAFLARYGAGLEAQISGEFAGDTALANNGERLAMSGAAGVIRDFSYNDRYPWPESPDGDGPSLVLIAPDSNPDHSLGSNWRASAGAMGSAGAGDAVPFTGDPTADVDGDGLSAFAEHAFGTSDSNASAGASVLQASFGADGRLKISYPENLAAEDALIMIELSGDLSSWTPAGEMLDLESEVHNGDGTATFTFESDEPLTPGERIFVRLKVTSR